MHLGTVAVVGVLLSAAHAQAQNSTPPTLPTWQEELAKGYAPYHQLTVEDFRIDDAAHPKDAFYIKMVVDPHYRFLLKSSHGFAFAYVEHWMVFSGLDKNETSRKSSLKNMKAELPYAQALLDLSEVYARQLAALQPGELPQGRGNSFEEAQSDLETKIKTFTEARYKAMSAEMDTLEKATKSGADRKKVRRLEDKIRKRLDGTPADYRPFRRTGSCDGKQLVGTDTNQVSSARTLTIVRNVAAATAARSAILVALRFNASKPSRKPHCS